MASADGAEKGRLRARLNELHKVVYSEKLGEMADEFDRVHSVQRALRVGALHRIIPPTSLRPYLIEAVRRGIEQEESRIAERAQRRAFRAAAGAELDSADGRVLVGTD
jgi:hypothetical protein